MPSYLQRQIEIIQPKIVATLGRFSMALFFPKNARISKIHGEPLRKDGRITFQYKTVSNDSSATVGVENYDGTMSWQTLCDREGTRLQSGLAMSYLPPDL